MSTGAFEHSCHDHARAAGRSGGCWLTALVGGARGARDDRPHAAAASRSDAVGAPGDPTRTAPHGAWPPPPPHGSGRFDGGPGGAPPHLSADPGGGPPRRLYRSRTERTVAGVCGGIGEYLGVDPVIVRLVMVGLFVLGFGFVIYPVAVLVIPKAPRGGVGAARRSRRHRRDHRADVGDDHREARDDRDGRDGRDGRRIGARTAHAQQLATSGVRRAGGRHLLGWALLVLGVVKMSDSLGLSVFGAGQNTLALMLIAGGLVVLWQRRHRTDATDATSRDRDMAPLHDVQGAAFPGPGAPHPDPFAPFTDPAGPFVTQPMPSAPSAPAAPLADPALVSGDPLGASRPFIGSAAGSVTTPVAATAGAPGAVGTAASSREDFVAQALAELYHPVEAAFVGSDQHTHLSTGTATAPSAWAPPMSAPRRRGALGPLSFGLLALAAGAVAGLAALGMPLPAARVLTASGLLWVGATLVLGAWLGRPRGFILLGLLLSALLALQTTVHISLDAGVGTRAYAASGPADLARAYRLGLGEISLDLRRLRIPGRRAAVAVEVGAGTIALALPSGPTAPLVRAHLHNTAGNFVLGPTDSGGLRVDETRTFNAGAPAANGVLELDVRVGFGEAELSTDGTFRDLELRRAPSADGAPAVTVRTSVPG